MGQQMKMMCEKLAVWGLPGIVSFLKRSCDGFVMTTSQSTS